MAAFTSAALIGAAVLAPPHRLAAAQAAANGAGQHPLPALTIVAPAAPGGGWDQLAREMAREIEGQRLAAAVQVENVPGAAGTIGLATFVGGRRGDGEALLVTGLVMLGAMLWNRSPVSIAQVTPVARLTGEYEVVAVPAGSPHRNMRDLVGALREDPAAVSWGGGSAGGTDHILAGLILEAAGLDPRRTNYIAFSGGGEAVTALIGGQVTAGISGFSEFAQHIASGRLRAIGVSAPMRLPDLDVPPLNEQGLDIQLANWRAVVAPPGLTEAERAALTSMVARMVNSDSWRATLAKFGWTDAYLGGAAFGAFLDEERSRMSRIVSRLRGSSDEAEASRAGEWLFPLLVLGCGAFLAALFIRGGAPAGSSCGHDLPAGRVSIGLVLFIGALNVAGFVAAGTMLFACTAWAFGSRRPLRDVLVGLTLCGIVYIAFTHGLGIPLPPGALAGGR